MRGLRREPGPDPVPDPDPHPQRGAGFSLFSAVIFYLFLLAASLAWLHLRGRLDILPGLAIGRHGVTVALGVGVAVGAGIITLNRIASRYLDAFRRLEERLAERVGPMSEAGILVLALVSGLAEEIFFRGALQDLVGPYFGALIFAGLHIAPGMKTWTLCALVVGVVFGGMVEAGFGLLSVSVAHALTNFLSLREMSLR